MSDVSLLLAWPDGRIRQQKAAWQASRRRLTDALRDVCFTAATGERRLVMCADDAALASTIGHDIGAKIDIVHNSAIAAGADPAADGYHAVVVRQHELDPQTRIEQMRWALGSVRPAGCLIVEATVVARRGERGAVWSTSELVAAIQRISRAAVHLEQVSSFRWPAEPFRRGVLLCATSLARTTGIAR